MAPQAHITAQTKFSGHQPLTTFGPPQKKQKNKKQSVIVIIPKIQSLITTVPKK